MNFNLNLNSLLILDECQIDNDCPYDKHCKINECRDPCANIICGTKASCKAEAHKAACYCPPGMQGNPLIGCSEAGCTSHSECSKNENCNYKSTSSSRKECLPLCTKKICARGATCTSRNHNEICTCNHPLQGDGYISCTECKQYLNISFRLYRFQLTNSRKFSWNQTNF